MRIRLRPCPIFSSNNDPRADRVRKKVSAPFLSRCRRRRFTTLETSPRTPSSRPFA